MTLCLSRNNPGCILPNPANPWKGMAAVQPPGPVAFISVIYGIRALYKILESYERDGISGQALYNNDVNYMRLWGRFSVDAGTTSVSFSVTAAGGSSPSITVKQNSYIQLLRLA